MQYKFEISCLAVTFTVVIDARSDGWSWRACPALSPHASSRIVAKYLQEIFCKCHFTVLSPAVCYTTFLYISYLSFQSDFYLRYTTVLCVLLNSIMHVSFIYIYSYPHIMHIPFAPSPFSPLCRTPSKLLPSPRQQWTYIGTKVVGIQYTSVYTYINIHKVCTYV